MKFLLLNSACSPFDTAPVCPLRLHVVSVYDGHNQTWKTLLDFLAPRRMAHLDPSTFAPNQASLPERFEMLRQRRFRDSLPRAIRAVCALDSSRALQSAPQLEMQHRPVPV